MRSNPLASFYYAHRTNPSPRRERLRVMRNHHGGALPVCGALGAIGSLNASGALGVHGSLLSNGPRTSYGSLTFPRFSQWIRLAQVRRFSHRTWLALLLRCSRCTAARSYSLVLSDGTARSGGSVHSDGTARSSNSALSMLSARSVLTVLSGTTARSPLPGALDIRRLALELRLSSTISACAHLLRCCRDSLARS